MKMQIAILILMAYPTLGVFAQNTEVKIDLPRESAT
jgi:hypothetical protein